MKYEIELKIHMEECKEKLFEMIEKKFDEITTKNRLEFQRREVENYDED
jgi:hypothetical protein